MWGETQTKCSHFFCNKKEKAVSKLFHIQLKMLLGLEFSRKTLLTDVLAVFGLLILALCLLKLTWKCCRGFRQYVLSSLCQVNLRAYGQWAGKVKFVHTHTQKFNQIFSHIYG